MGPPAPHPLFPPTLLTVLILFLILLPISLFKSSKHVRTFLFAIGFTANGCLPRALLSFTPSGECSVSKHGACPCGFTLHSCVIFHGLGEPFICAVPCRQAS